MPPPKTDTQAHPKKTPNTHPTLSLSHTHIHMHKEYAQSTYNTHTQSRHMYTRIPVRPREIMMIPRATKSFHLVSCSWPWKKKNAPTPAIDFIAASMPSKKIEDFLVMMLILHSRST